MTVHIPLQRTRSGIAGVTRLAPPHLRQVPMAMVQGMLALELDSHPGLPRRPSCGWSPAVPTTSTAGPPASRRRWSR